MTPQPPANSNHKAPDVVSLGDEDAVQKVVSQTVLGLWDIVNNLTRLQPTKREHYRVTIFGSARTRQGSLIYDEVKRLATELVALGCDIITGGGPGLMQAANEGASSLGMADKNRSIGIRVSLDFEQDTNPFVGQVYEHRTFFSRLHHFILLSDAFVVVPGGIGTTLELAMVWQLLQVRKLYGTPLILVGQMWKDLVTWSQEHMLSFQPPMADAVDLVIPKCVENVEAAVAIIREHRQQWVAEMGQM